jgi:hypothetical protein
MNFSVQNNSLPRPVVVPQWLFELPGRLPSTSTYFSQLYSVELIRFERADPRATKEVGLDGVRLHAIRATTGAAKSLRGEPHAYGIHSVPTGRLVSRSIDRCLRLKAECLRVLAVERVFISKLDAPSFSTQTDIAADNGFAEFVPALAVGF